MSGAAPQPGDYILEKRDDGSCMLFRLRAPDPKIQPLYGPCEEVMRQAKRFAGQKGVGLFVRKKGADGCYCHERIPVR